MVELLNGTVKVTVTGAPIPVEVYDDVRPVFATDGSQESTADDTTSIPVSVLYQPSAVGDESTDEKRGENRGAGLGLRSGYESDGYDSYDSGCGDSYCSFCGRYCSDCGRDRYDCVCGVDCDYCGYPVMDCRCGPYEMAQRNGDEWWYDEYNGVWQSGSPDADEDEYDCDYDNAPIDADDFTVTGNQGRKSSRSAFVPRSAVKAASHRRYETGAELPKSAIEGHYTKCDWPRHGSHRALCTVPCTRRLKTAAPVAPVGASTKRIHRSQCTTCAPRRGKYNKQHREPFFDDTAIGYDPEAEVDDVYEPPSDMDSDCGCPCCGGGGYGGYGYSSSYGGYDSGYDSYDD